MFFCFCFVLFVLLCLIVMFEYPNMHATEGSTSTRRIREAGHASRRRECTQKLQEEGVVSRRQGGVKERRADVEHQSEHQEYMDLQQEQPDVELQHIPQVHITDEAVEWMVTYLGSDMGDALKEVKKIICTHCRFGYLERIFKERLKDQRDLVTEYVVTEEVRRLRDQCVRIYFLNLMGIMIFTNKSQWNVDVVYLRYFRDLDLVAGYSWGAAALTHLYRELNNAARWNCSQVAGYLTLLQV